MFQSFTTQFLFRLKTKIFFILCIDTLASLLSLSKLFSCLNGREGKLPLYISFLKDY